MLCLVYFLCLFFASVCGELSFVKVDPVTKFFVDEQERTRIFHGVNAVFKMPPYYPSYSKFDANFSLSPEDAKNLHEWGFNVVRLYVAWPGVEPQKGNYSDEYFNNLRNIVDILANEGIYTLLDCHQGSSCIFTENNRSDVGSGYFCGEGIPDDYVSEQRTSKHKFPSPLPIKLPLDPTTQKPVISDCLKHGFSEYYWTVEVAELWQNLYTPGSELNEAFPKFWKTVASTFSSVNSVLGYELINEPFLGDFFKHLSLLEVGKTDRTLLVPFYKKIFESINSVDDRHMIMFEPVVWEAFAHSGFSTCFTDIPRCVFAYHVYCGLVDPKGDPKSKALCKTLDDSFIRLRDEDFRRIGGGVIATEFGAIYNDSSSVKELHWVIGEMEKRMHSWIYWQFKYFDDITTADKPQWVESFYDMKGNLQIEKVKALSRTYVPVTCGTPIHAQFDPLTSEFVYQFKAAKIEGENTGTVLFLNQQFYYPNGFNVTMVPQQGVSYKQIEKNYLLFVHSTSLVGQTISIHVTKK